MANEAATTVNDNFDDFGSDDDDFINIDLESVINQARSKKQDTAPLADSNQGQLSTIYTIITPKRKHSASPEPSTSTANASPAKRTNNPERTIIHKVRNAKSGRVGTPLQVYRYGRIWVSDIMAQMWCEQQLVYRFDPPKVPPLVPIVEPPEVKIGHDIHLARELAIQDVVTVKVTSAEDRLAMKLVNLAVALHSMLELGVTVFREVPVFGAPFGMGVFVVGVIDELRCDPDSLRLDLVEFKTRASKEMPPHAQAVTHNLQMMLYKCMFDEMVRGALTKLDFANHLHVNLHRPLGKDMQEHVEGNHRSSGKPAPTTLDSLLDSLFTLMCAVPFLSNRLTVQYEYQCDGSLIGESSVDYDEVWLHAELTKAFQFWHGKRQAEGVDIEDMWKCRRCPFDGRCSWQETKLRELNLCKETVDDMEVGATDETVGENPTASDLVAFSENRSTVIKNEQAAVIDLVDSSEVTVITID